MDVTGAVQNALMAGDPDITFQFLFSMMTDGNSDNDFANFVDAQNLAGAPEGMSLILTY